MNTSHLARLYEAAFGQAPSAASTQALLVMEETFGLAQDDPLARMLIVQLRATDEARAVTYASKVAASEQTRQIKEAIGELSTITRQLDQVFRLRRPRLDDGGSLGVRQQVDAYKRALPLLSYLGEAFRFASSVTEEQERTWLARFDLCLFVGLLSAAALMGASLHAGC